MVYGQGSRGPAHWRPLEMLADGQENSPLMANRFAHQESAALAMLCSSINSLGSTLPGEGLREADGVAGGLADVSVVK